MICPICMEEHEPKIMWEKHKLCGVEYDYEFTFCEITGEVYVTAEQMTNNYQRWKKVKGEE